MDRVVAREVDGIRGGGVIAARQSPATERTEGGRAGCGPAMSANNCDSMTYFANAYMPDMRSGGHEQPQHAHYGAVPQQHELDGCDPQLRPAQHHYPAQPAPGMPYPRFPPYDRLGYYQQMDQNGYRPESPSQMVHMGPKSDGYGPNGHQPPAPVYTSCKLQAAAGGGGGVAGGVAGGSPPLDGQQLPQHMPHMGVAHVPHQQHLMYPHVDDMQHQTQMPPMHQQPMHAQQPPPQQPPPNNNASLPSPLYPWMRSQFGEFCFYLLINSFCNYIH